MTGQSRGVSDYREVLDPRRRRKALLYRAALAIGVMVLLVIGLTLFDNDASESPQSQGSAVREEVLPPPLPDETLVEERPVTIARIDVSGPQEGTPAGEHEFDDAGLDEAGLDEAGLDEADVASDATPDAEARLQETDVGNARLGEPVAEMPSKPVAVAAARVSPKADSPPRATALRVVSSGFQVLASDFVEAASADTLLGALSDDGYQVGSQSRVTVGPFERWADAESAMARLRSEHALRGIIVNAPSGAGFVVQLGVFAEAHNAAALVQRLEASGQSVLLQRRVLLGPYADREAAEAIVAQLRASRALEAQIVALPGR